MPIFSARLALLVLALLFGGCAAPVDSEGSDEQLFGNIKFGQGKNRYCSGSVGGEGDRFVMYRYNTNSIKSGANVTLKIGEQELKFALKEQRGVFIGTNASYAVAFQNGKKDMVIGRRSRPSETAAWGAAQFNEEGKLTCITERVVVYKCDRQTLRRPEGNLVFDLSISIKNPASLADASMKPIEIKNAATGKVVETLSMVRSKHLPHESLEFHSTQTREQTPILTLSFQKAGVREHPAAYLTGGGPYFRGSKLSKDVLSMSCDAPE